MGFSNENNQNIIKPTNVEGGLEMGSRKFGKEIRQTRRALGIINTALVGYPCVVNKRELPGKKAVCDMSQKDSVNGLMTRKFSGQSEDDNQQHVSNDNAKKAKATDTSSNEFGEFIFIDVEEDSKECSTNDNDNPVPMFLEEPEPKPDAMFYSSSNETEEVEMEDIDAINDIDGCDSNNPLAVVHYVEDLYAFYRKMEGLGCVSPNYMDQQTDINEKMRAILIDWLIEVHDKFDLMSETLFLTVNLIDRFLCQQSLVRKKLQLAGLVAMLLACKYEEVSVPVLGDLILISDKAYSREDILQMEKCMLKTLQFNMSLPTPYVFMQRFLKAAECNKKVEMLSFFLIELSLVEYEMLKFQPSLLAAAAVYTAQCTLYGVKQWSRTCEWHCNYTEEELLECTKLMVGFHQKASTGRLTGVHRKYCSSKFGFTAKCEPALFLL